MPQISKSLMIDILSFISPAHVFEAKHEEEHDSYTGKVGVDQMQAVSNLLQYFNFTHESLSLLCRDARGTFIPPVESLVRIGI